MTNEYEMIGWVLSFPNVTSLISLANYGGKMSGGYHCNLAHSDTCEGQDAQEAVLNHLLSNLLSFTPIIVWLSGMVRILSPYYYIQPASLMSMWRRTLQGGNNRKESK